MAAKERERSSEELKDKPYLKAVSFADDEKALTAYTLAQEIVFQSECDLSAYRLRFQDVPHVVVLGSAPRPVIDEKLARALSVGEPADLPSGIIQTLVERRKQARQLGPWVEGHYRPGRPV